MSFILTINFMTITFTSKKKKIVYLNKITHLDLKNKRQTKNKVFYK